RSARAAVERQAFYYPLVDSVLCIHYVATLGGSSDQGLERHADDVFVADARVKEHPILAVAGDQVVFTVVERECLGDALNRFRESTAGLANFPKIGLLDLYRCVAEHAKRLRHSANFVSAFPARDVNRRIAGREIRHRFGDALQWPNNPW